uniref:Uncharacterized protein n=1 Tax=Trichogramma kaykai TaxID=54128 RepID=A0ABD2VYL0_9HYME
MIATNEKGLELTQPRVKTKLCAMRKMAVALEFAHLLPLMSRAAARWPPRARCRCAAKTTNSQKPHVAVAGVPRILRSSPRGRCRCADELVAQHRVAVADAPVESSSLNTAWQLPMRRWSPG